MYYNGLRREDFAQDRTLANGVRAWNNRGGICGPGVLLDWAS